MKLANGIQIDPRVQWSRAHRGLRDLATTGVGRDRLRRLAIHLGMRGSAGPDIRVALRATYTDVGVAGPRPHERLAQAINAAGPAGGSDA